jgi:hypothetical protein
MSKLAIVEKLEEEEEEEVKELSKQEAGKLLRELHQKMDVLIKTKTKKKKKEETDGGWW